MASDSFRVLAAKAVKILLSSEKIEEIAIRGFLRGIADGNIKTGQNWPIGILLRERGSFKPEFYPLLEDIFASGIFTEGQQLVEKYRAEPSATR